jgi:hypothetical protein
MSKFELKLRRRNNTEQARLADLQRVAKDLGLETITKTTYDQYGHFGATTFIRRFGSWNGALNAAALTLTNRINIPDEELFENLATCWRSLGRQPVGKDLSKGLGLSRFSLGTYEKRFGSWNRSLVAFIEFIESPAEKGVDETVMQNQPLRREGRTTRKINWRLRANVLMRDSCICQMCGASPAKDPAVILHADHIKPWSRGGETTLDNLQTLCLVCNIGKSDTTFDG